MRQLFSLPRALPACICALVFAHALHAGDEKPAPAQPEQELQAAKLMETAMFARIEGHENERASRDDLEKMAAIYAGITSRYPKNVKALNAEADYLWLINRRDDAMEKWKTSESLDPDNAETENSLGGCELAFGHAEKAVEYFERATKLAPQNALYHLNAANSGFMFRHQVAGEKGDPETVLLKALEHYRIATQLEPCNAGYARAYAETFYILKQPDWDTALSAWKHFLDITPDKDFAYSNLVRVHLKLGRKKEAQDDLDHIQGEKFAGLKQHFQQEIDSK